MSKLQVSIAVGDYDRVRPLVDGSVQIDGVDPVFMLLEPEEIFFRAFRHADFDICELSMSSFTVKTADGRLPLCRRAGVSVTRVPPQLDLYPHRSRHHAAGGPEGQAHRRAGISGHRQCMDARGAGGRTRREAVGRHLGARRLRAAGPDREDRAEPAARRAGRGRAGRCDDLRHAGGRRDRCGDRPARAVMLWTGIRRCGGCIPIRLPRRRQWFRKTRIFPIMHILGIRRTLAEQHPWLPVAAMKAFEQSKARALEKLGTVAASKVTLPFIDEQLHAARRLMGDDFWSYGLDGQPARAGGFSAAASCGRAVSAAC